MIKKERNVMNELLLIEFIIVSRAKGRFQCRYVYRVLINAWNFGEWILDVKTMKKVHLHKYFR